jgi:hypothetical protein
MSPQNAALKMKMALRQIKEIPHADCWRDSVKRGMFA